MQAADSTSHPVRACVDTQSARSAAPTAAVAVRPPSRSPVRRGRRRSGAAAPSTVRRRTARALASDLGQGTVEYVGLLLLMASVLAAVVTASKSLGGEDKIGKQVVTQIGDSIKMAGDAKR